VHGRGQARRHEARQCRGVGAPAGRAGLASATRQHQVTALAHEDAAVVQHHAGVQKGEIAEQVLDLTLSA